MGVPLLELMKEDSEYDRTFKRYRVSFPVSVAPADGGGEAVPGLGHNVSLSGVGFVCSTQYDLGDLLDLDVTWQGQTFPLRARVRWRRPLDLPGEPMYLYGTKFERTEAVLRFIPVAAEFLLAQGAVRRPERKASEPLAVG